MESAAGWIVCFVLGVVLFGGCVSASSIAGNVMAEGSDGVDFDVSFHSSEVMFDQHGNVDVGATFSQSVLAGDTLMVSSSLRTENLSLAPVHAVSSPVLMTTNAFALNVTGVDIDYAAVGSMIEGASVCSDETIMATNSSLVHVVRARGNGVAEVGFDDIGVSAVYVARGRFNVTSQMVHSLAAERMREERLNIMGLCVWPAGLEYPVFSG